MWSKSRSPTEVDRSTFFAWKSIDRLLPILKVDRSTFDKIMRKSRSTHFRCWSTFLTDFHRLLKKEPVERTIGYVPEILQKTENHSVLGHNFWYRRDRNTNRLSFESLDVGRKSLGYGGPQFCQKFLSDTRKDEFLNFFHFGIPSKSPDVGDFYGSLLCYISMNKNRRDVLKPSLEPSNIAFNTLFFKTVFADTWHTKFLTLKILDFFEENSKKKLIRQKFLIT